MGAAACMPAMASETSQNEAATAAEEKAGLAEARKVENPRLAATVFIN